MKKIALFPGCFDPFHKQHHYIVEVLLADKTLNLDQIWILINDDSQEKTIIHSFKKRYQIIANLWKNHSLADKTYLYPQPITFYTSDLIKKLKQKTPNNLFYLVLGTDQVNKLPTWEKLDNLAKIVTIVAVPRAGYPLDLTLKNLFTIYSLTLNQVNNFNSTSIKAGEDGYFQLHSSTVALLKIEEEIQFFDWLKINQPKNKIFYSLKKFKPINEGQTSALSTGC